MDTIFEMSAAVMRSRMSLLDHLKSQRHLVQGRWGAEEGSLRAVLRGARARQQEAQRSLMPAVSAATMYSHLPL